MISIIIPTYNRPKLLQRAVRSALAALPKGGEIIVIDDGTIPASETLSEFHTDGIRLIVVENVGAKGAAGARNFGSSVASLPVILFLDDDDELLPDYASRVQRISESCAVAGFGFSSVLLCESDQRQVIAGLRPFSAGLVPEQASLRHHIFGFGAGFWVRRDLMLNVGGIPEAQTVDEDTSFCLRLLRVSARGWYEADPGVRVFRGHSTSDSNADQLTRKTPAETVLQCYLRTWLDHESDFEPWSEARWFLAARYLRRVAKIGNFAEGWQFVRHLSPYHFRMALSFFWLAKVASMKLRRTWS